MSRVSKLAVAVASLTLASCSAPILGAWKSDDQMSYYNGVYRPNRLTLGNDQTGEAIISYMRVDDGTVHTDQYEARWTENTSTSYTLNLSCVFRDGLRTDCHDTNFVMTCSLPSTDTVMAFSCTGTDFFNSYPFNWVPYQPPTATSGSGG